MLCSIVTQTQTDFHYIYLPLRRSAIHAERFCFIGMQFPMKLKIQRRDLRRCTQSFYTYCFKSSIAVHTGRLSLTQSAPYPTCGSGYCVNPGSGFAPRLKYALTFSPYR